MVYQIKFRQSAEKEFGKLEKSLQQRIYQFLMQRVAPDPLLLREPLLGNKKGLWKYRLGDYRIICQIQNKEMVVLVVSVAHRKEVYK